MGGLTYPAGPAITAVVQQQPDGLFYPQNYAARALCRLAGTPHFTEVIAATARELGIRVDVKQPLYNPFARAHTDSRVN